MVIELLKSVSVHFAYGSGGQSCFAESCFVIELRVERLTGIKPTLGCSGKAEG